MGKMGGGKFPSRKPLPTLAGVLLENSAFKVNGSARQAWNEADV